MKEDGISEDLLSLLRTALDDDKAEFRSRQEEVIRGILEGGGRSLVVQRTGWGKSMIYFLATKLLRMRGAGPTLIISPLLSLMRDQVLASNRLGLSSERIDSSNTDSWDQVAKSLQVDIDEIDILFVSPERLANNDFITKVFPLFIDRMRLIVIDEAHCISDWGHDFRPDYRRIRQVLKKLHRDVRILATTATANDRVIADLEHQLGPGLKVERGDLVRESLSLQAIESDSMLERFAWIASAIKDLPGSGIIYTLTLRDASRVASWLQHEGHDVHSYTGDMQSALREELEDRLRKGDVKALVATSALGMGFDKPDLGFVVHFQRPQSPVHYYQQVGRAGRAIPDALGILLSGSGDSEILDWFIQNAFPHSDDVKSVLKALRDAGDEGCTLNKLQSIVNVRRKRLEHLLKFLSCENPSPVRKEGSKWFATATGEYALPLERMRNVNKARDLELHQMREYVAAKECHMMFLQRTLDDSPVNIKPCGRCAVCLGRPLINVSIDEQVLERAKKVLNKQYIKILPRKRWPVNLPENDARGWGTTIGDFTLETGYALCHFSDPIRGAVVRAWKQEGEPLPDTFIYDIVSMIRGNWKPEPYPKWVACVPSLRSPTRVAELAKKIAQHLDLPFYQQAVQKQHETAPQKMMENSVTQVRNIADAFRVSVPPSFLSQPVFLVDDIVDSRWTMTMIGALLKEAGASEVFPLAVASTSNAS